MNVTPVKDVQNRTLKKSSTAASDQTPEPSREFRLRWATADRGKSCWQEREVPCTFGQKAASDVLATVTTGRIKRLLIFVQASPLCFLSIFVPFLSASSTEWMRNAGNSLSTGSTEEPVVESVLRFQE